MDKKLLACVWLLSLALPAAAHLRNHPELDQWFNSLHSNEGHNPCCSGSDATELVDPQWDIRVEDGVTHYEVWLDHQWVRVPPSAVVDAPNRFGPALLWTYKGVNDIVYIRCFLPGAGA